MMVIRYSCYSETPFHSAWSTRSQCPAGTANIVEDVLSLISEKLRMVVSAVQKWPKNGAFYNIYSDISYMLMVCIRVYRGTVALLVLVSYKVQKSRPIFSTLWTFHTSVYPYYSIFILM